MPMVGDLAGQLVHFGEAEYLLNELLGFGGMGEVYLARRVAGAPPIRWDTSDLAAVKVVRQDVAAYLGKDVRAFADEVRLHRYFDHPNVVPVRGVAVEDGTLYMMMEYLEGNDLDGLLELTRFLKVRLTEGAVCTILAAVADALGYLHDFTDEHDRPLHIVHRDVSPQNIRVTTAGGVKLMDFGVAKHVAEWRKKTSTTKGGGFKGKVMYLSPEQARGEPLDGRSDLFALGCILVECVIGRPLFNQGLEPLVLKAVQDVTSRYVEEALQEVSVSEELKVICLRLLAPKPEHRYASGREVAAALRDYGFRRKQYALDSNTLADEVAELERLGVELGLAHDAGPGDVKGAPAPPRAPEPPPGEPGEEKRKEPASRFVHLTSIILAVAASVLVLALAIYFLRPWPPPPNEEWSSMPDTPAFPLSPPPFPSDVVIEKATPATIVTPRNTSPSVARKCVGIAMAGALAAASGCHVRVATNTRTGDCIMKAPPHDINGHQLPDRVPVQFVSLNGEKCQGKQRPCGPISEREPSCWYAPCPAGEGQLVMVTVPTIGMSPLPPELEFLRGARFRGKARVAPGPETVGQRGFTPYKATGRMLVLFTEVELKDGAKAPICGVLYTSPRWDEKEGIPVLDASYWGAPATPTIEPEIHLFWP